MPTETIPIDRPRAIHRAKGITVTILNNSAVAVHYTTDESALMFVVPGAVPGGIPIAAAATAQIPSNPGTFYMRAVGAGPVNIIVEP